VAYVTIKLFEKVHLGCRFYCIKSCICYYEWIWYEPIEKIAKKRSCIFDRCRWWNWKTDGDKTW